MRFLTALALSLASTSAFAAEKNTCDKLPNHDQLEQALKAAVASSNGGLNLPMWGTLVDRSGVVCAVAYSGDTVDAQWPGSRAISAQKANTANAFSLKGMALSTANLYSAVQPGGSLYGLQASNPVNAALLYAGDANSYGGASDPLVGGRIGGVNVFGGGLALYNDKGEILGGLGVSGDSSCADHNISWRVRHALSVDFVPAGVAPDKSDQIIYDISKGKSAGGFGHAACAGTEQKIAKTLPAVSKVKIP